MTARPVVCFCRIQWQLQGALLADPDLCLSLRPHPSSELWKPRTFSHIDCGITVSKRELPSLLRYSPEGTHPPSGAQNHPNFSNAQHRRKLSLAARKTSGFVSLHPDLVAVERLGQYEERCHKYIFCMEIWSLFLLQLSKVCKNRLGSIFG